MIKLKPVASFWGSYFLVIFFILSIVFLLQGCEDIKKTRQLAINTASATSALVLLDSQFEDVSQQVTRVQAFNADEIKTLTRSKNELNVIRKELHQLIKGAGGLPQFLMDADKVELWYEQIKINYIVTRQIIEQHFKDLSPALQRELVQYDELAKQADSAVLAMRAHLLANPQTNDVTHIVRDVITIGAVTAKVLLIAGII